MLSTSHFFQQLELFTPSVWGRFWSAVRNCDSVFFEDSTPFFKRICAYLWTYEGYFVLHQLLLRSSKQKWKLWRAGRTVFILTYVHLAGILGLLNLFVKPYGSWFQIRSIKAKKSLNENLIFKSFLRLARKVHCLKIFELSSDFSPSENVYLPHAPWKKFWEL